MATISSWQNPLPLSPEQNPGQGLPAEGFEPPTYGLQNRCTTTVLSRRGEGHIITGRARRGESPISSIANRPFFRRRSSRLFLTQQIHRRLVQLGPQQKTFVGARDVANRNFHAAHDGFDVDAGRSRENLAALR